MPWGEISADPSKFLEAVEAHGKRIVITAEQARKLDDRAKQEAFWVGGGLQLAQIQRVFDALNASIEKGEPFADFKKRVRNELTNAAHVETVYRNAVQRAYNAGRWQQMTEPSTAKFRPFWLFDATLDTRTCFAAGTPVKMADGTTRPIEAVRTGDAVLSCRGLRRTVVATLATPARAWGAVTLSDGTRITVTPNHPFLTAHGWIRAKLLRVGDQLVRESDRLPRLWRDVPHDAQRGEVLLRPLPPERHADASVPRMREGLPSGREGRSSLVLRQAVQARHVEASQGVPRLWDRLPPSRSQQHGLLQAGVCSRAPGLPALLEGVRVHAPVRQARAVPVLLQRMQGSGAPPRTSALGDAAALSALREDVSREAALDRQVQPSLLLEALPEAAAPAMPRLLARGEGSQSAILLGELLSALPGRDRARGCRSTSAGGGPDTVRARSKDRALVDRLSSRQPGLPRSGRRLLAPSAERQGEGRSAGQAADGAGLRGDPVGRGGGQRGSSSRDPRAVGLWPFPSDEIEAAPAATVAAVHWYLTDEAQPAYDIQVDHDAGFIACGVVVHNSTICKACHGTLLPYDHPWWDTHLCPLHHRCRSSIRNLRRAEAEKRGITQTPNADAVPAGWGLSPRLYNGPIKPNAAKTDPVLLAELNRKAAGGEKKRKPRTPKEHTAKHWQASYEPRYGKDAAKSLAHGRAALERGLDMKVSAAREHLRRMREAPGVQSMLEALQDADADRTVREQGGELDPLRKIAAALAGHVSDLPAQRPAVTHKDVAKDPIGSRALRWYSAVAGPKVQHPGVDWKITRKDGRRSFADPDKREIEYSGTRIGALEHEWGHAIESLTPALTKRAIAFLEARTRNEKDQRLSALTGDYRYKPSEVARPDAFWDVYVGKMYRKAGKVWATEITSMGVEALFAGKHGTAKLGRLVQKDPEHFLFVLGQLAGE